MTKLKQFNWHRHGLLLFVAVSFGVGLSYIGINYFDHPSRAAALPLLQYVSPDRSEAGASPKYPICPHLVDATVDGTAVLQDLCTDLYWSRLDNTTTGSRDHITSNDPQSPFFVTKKETRSVLGNTWYEAFGKKADGTPVANPACSGKYRLPTPDELLTLAFVPCGAIKYCENSADAPTLCQTESDCAVPKSSNNKVCSDGLTISCSVDKDCMDRGAGFCSPINTLAYCSNNPSRSCNTNISTSCDTTDVNGNTVAKGDGDCTPRRYSCVPDACSPIVRGFGTYKYSNLSVNPGTEAAVSPTKRLLGDGSYWTNRQLDEIKGSQCTANTAVSCSTPADCAGECVANVPVDPKEPTKRHCTNDTSVSCLTVAQCDFGMCKPFESAVSVNLKYGTVNNPIMGKETLLNVRCIYQPTP